ncbi:MAG: hypothetical protein ACYDIA_05690 [Candidatus Humimicrobiaceae bacterium]
MGGGLTCFIIFLAFAGLAGANNNGKALLPGIYGTSSVMWGFFAVIAVILFIIGLVMTIVNAAKNRKSK